MGSNDELSRSAKAMVDGFAEVGIDVDERAFDRALYLCSLVGTQSVEIIKSSKTGRYGVMVTSMLPEDSGIVVMQSDDIDTLIPVGGIVAQDLLVEREGGRIAMRDKYPRAFGAATFHLESTFGALAFIAGVTDQVMQSEPDEVVCEDDYARMLDCVRLVRAVSLQAGELLDMMARPAAGPMDTDSLMQDLGDRLRVRWEEAEARGRKAACDAEDD